MFIHVGCGSDGNDTLAWCSADGTLDVSCDAPYCVAGVIVDYKRLEPRGYRVAALSGDPITAREAEQVAAAYVGTAIGVPASDSVDCEQEGDFIHCALVYPSLDRFLVVLHQPTGSVLVAEPELWAHAQKRGYDFPLPVGFLNANALGCITPPIAAPERHRSVVTGFPLGTAVASTPDDALDVVLQLNLAEDFVSGRPYDAFTISHAPALGEFDPESADWHIWLSLTE